MERHISIERRLTSLEKLRFTEIVILVIGFALALGKLWGIFH